MLFMKHDTPFVLCFTSSFKKHNAFRAVLNDSDERFTVRWEDRAIEVDRNACTSLFRGCVHLYFGGFTKEEISNNTFALHRCMKYGIGRFNEHYEIIKPYFRTNLLEFICEALPSRKRETYVKIIAEREKSAKAAKGASNGRNTGTNKRGKSG
jgi:hypothetical protein